MTIPTLRTLGNILGASDDQADVFLRFYSYLFTYIFQEGVKNTFNQELCEEAIPASETEI